MDKLYDPHVVITWRKCTKPFSVSVHLLASGAGEKIATTLPENLTGLARTRAVLEVSDKITSGIYEMRHNCKEDIKAFVRECLDELNAAFPEGVEPTSKDIYDYSNKLTAKLLARDIVPTADDVAGLIARVVG